MRRMTRGPALCFLHVLEVLGLDGFSGDFGELVKDRVGHYVDASDLGFQRNLKDGYQWLHAHL